MARGATPDSASAQYFFVFGPAAQALETERTYVVFGHTDEAGMQLLHQLEHTRYHPCPPSDQVCLGGILNLPSLRSAAQGRARREIVRVQELS